MGIDAFKLVPNWWDVTIYDENDRLTEIHDKFPVDKGHRKL